MRLRLRFHRSLAFAMLLTGAGLHAQESNLRDGIRFGRSVLALEDFDGDGVRDFAVGAPAAPGALARSGVVIVMSGATRAVLQEWRGEPTRRSFGFTLQNAGDVNGDATLDVLVGHEQQARCEVRSGKDGTLLLAFDRGWEEVIAFGDSNSDGAGDLLLVTGSQLEIRNGRNGQMLGWGVSLYKSGRVDSVGDLDGDGLVDFVLISDEPELFLSAPIEKRVGSGIYYPSQNRKQLMELWPDVFRLRSSNTRPRKESPPPRFSAAPAGDLDGDGARDFLLSVSWWESGVALGLSLDHKEPLFQINGIRGIGTTTCMAPDLNGDGHPDILLAKPASAFEISVRAHSGLDGKRLWTSDWSDGGATTGLSLALVENAAGLPELLVGSSEWSWHGPPPARVGELRQLSLAAGKVLWKLPVDQLAKFRRNASKESSEAR